MPIPEKYQAQFEELKYYHVCTRASQQHVLFESDENRRFFLQRYISCLSPFVDTLSYCLCDNHVHFFIRIKDENIILDYLKELPLKERFTAYTKYLEKANSRYSIDELIEFSFNRLFKSYALSFNKYFKRKGNLFQSPFRRIEVNADAHLMQLLVYIHANPLKHGFYKDFTNYKWSSYNELFKENTWLAKSEIMNWFGSKEAFIDFHLSQAQYYYENPFSTES